MTLLEDCVTLGDTDAMLVLAQCCAFGQGIEHDVERAESLICEAADKGNDEAQCLMKHLDDFQGEQMIGSTGLFCPMEERFESIHSIVHHRANQG